MKERCFKCGEEEVVWSVDFSHQDIYPDSEYEGTISVYRCCNCDCTYEVTKIYNSED